MGSLQAPPSLERVAGFMLPVSLELVQVLGVGVVVIICPTRYVPAGLSGHRVEPPFSVGYFVGWGHSSPLFAWQTEFVGGGVGIVEAVARPRLPPWCHPWSHGSRTLGS